MFSDVLFAVDSEEKEDVGSDNLVYDGDIELASEDIRDDDEDEPVACKL